MGPKRRHPSDPECYVPNCKQGRLCEPRIGSEEAELETDELLNFEHSIEFSIPIEIKHEIDPLAAVTQDIQTETNHKNFASGSGYSFLEESVKTEVKVEGDPNLESQNYFPSTSNTSSGKISDLDPLIPYNDVEIKEESETPHKIPLTTKKNQSTPYVCSRELGTIPLEIKLEPYDIRFAADDSLVEIKAEPLVREEPGEAKNAIALLNADIKDEEPENVSMGKRVDDSLEKECMPVTRTEVELHCEAPHDSHGATANEDDDPAGPINESDLVLDPETGLLVPAGDTNQDNDHEDFPDVSQVSEIASAEDCGSWNDRDAPDSLTTEETGQPQCSKTVMPSPTPSEDNLSVQNSLDHPETPTESSLIVSVSMLLAQPFSSGFWTADQQNEILVQLIPLSKWDHKTIYNPEQIFLSEFDFGPFPWLCESNEIQRFFCWSCLLFASAEPIWSISASSNCDQDFEEALVDHKISLEHLNAQTTYESKKKFALSSKKEHNLDKFIKLWQRFVRTVCLEKRNDKILGLELAAELRDNFKPFHKNMTSATVFQLSKNILSFGTNHLKRKVIDDVRNAQYVILHLEDLSTYLEGKTWFAVIARYAGQNGFIDERVIDIVKTFPARMIRTAGAAMKSIKHIFEYYRLTANVVGFSYSASVVLPHQIPLFHDSILRLCPRALFFHSPWENLYTSLFQAISHVPLCRRYFKDAQKLCEFMTANRSLIASIEKLKGCFPSTPLPETFDAYFAANLRYYYSSVLKIFQRIVSSTQCSPEVDREAKRHVRFLQSPNSRILIILIGLMSATVSGLAAGLGGRLGLEFFMEQRRNSIKLLKSIKSCGITDMLKMTRDRALGQIVKLTPKSNEMVLNIIDTAVAFLTHRFKNFEQFEYISSDLLKVTLKFAKYPVQSPEFIKRAGLNQNEMSQLKRLLTSPFPPRFTESRNHTELLNLLIQQNKTAEYKGLHKYLIFVHLMSFAKTRQKELLKSIQTFIQKGLPDVTRESLDDYFWQIENDEFVKILQDPELYSKALQVCQLKIVIENEFDVKIVKYSHFS